MLKDTKLKDNIINIIVKCNNKNITIWNFVSHETGKNQKTNNSTLNLDGKYISLNENSLNMNDNSRVQCCTTSDILNSTFFIHTIDKHESIDIIKKIKNKSNAGIDYITAKILKAVAVHIAEHCFISLIYHCHLVNFHLF